MRIRSQGEKIQLKTAKTNFLLLKLKYELFIRKIIKKFLWLNGSSSFSMKISQKRKKIKLKFFLFFKKPELDSDPNPFYSLWIQDPHQNEMDPKHCIILGANLLLQ